MSDFDALLWILVQPLLRSIDTSYTEAAVTFGWTDPAITGREAPDR